MDNYSYYRKNLWFWWVRGVLILLANLVLNARFEIRLVEL